MLRVTIIAACVLTTACSSEHKKPQSKPVEGANMSMPLAPDDGPTFDSIDDIPHVEARTVVEQVALCEFATRVAATNPATSEIPADMPAARIAAAHARWQKRMTRVMQYQAEYPSEDLIGQRSEEAASAYGLQAQQERQDYLVECVRGLS